MDDSTFERGEPTGVPSTGASPRERMEAVLYELRRVVVGQDRLLDRVLVSLLARGHVLLEGVPGLAKTLTLETVARVSGGRFNRIQFTPDLVPSDVVGGQVLDRHGDFTTRLGPGVRELRAGGRDQPRPGEGAVGAARGDGRGPRQHRRRDPPHAAAVLRARHAEPDRERGRLPAARGPGQPVRDEADRGLPVGLRRGGDRAPHGLRPAPAAPAPGPGADHRAPGGGRRASSSTTACASTPSAW